MRVAYITGRYPAISHTFIAREVRALRAHGLDVTTFSIWPTDQSLLLSQVDREEYETTEALLSSHPLHMARAHVKAVLSRPRRYFATAARALRLRSKGLRGWGLALSWFLETIVLWHHCQKLEITHVHAHLNGTAPTVALLAIDFADDTTKGGKTWTWSMTVHGPSEFYDTLGEQLAEKVQSATFVICISDFARSQLMGLVEERHWSKLHVVHCGVDPTAFAPSPPRSQGEEIHILNVSRLAPAKGQVVLVEALALMRQNGIQARLTIIGEGPMRSDIERVAQKLGMTPHITLAGAVGQDEVKTFYDTADVFCMSSFAEGVPIVLMESMAKEIPVVAPAIMGIPELIENDVNGILIRPARPDELADALARLAASPSLRTELGQHGRQRIIEEFNVGRCAEQLHGIFLASPSGTPEPIDS